MAHKSRRKILISAAIVLAKSVSGQGMDERGAIISPDRRRSMSTPATVRNRIMAEDHKKNLEDLDKLTAMVKQLKENLEKSGTLTLSAPAIRNADQIQKLAKKVHDRLRGSN